MEESTPLRAGKDGISNVHKKAPVATSMHFTSPCSPEKYARPPETDGDDFGTTSVLWKSFVQKNLDFFGKIGTGRDLRGSTDNPKSSKSSRYENSGALGYVEKSRRKFRFPKFAKEKIHTTSAHASLRISRDRKSDFQEFVRSSTSTVGTSGRRIPSTILANPSFFLLFLTTRALVRFPFDTPTVKSAPDNGTEPSSTVAI